MTDLYSFLEKVKAVLPLSSVLARFLKLRRHGHEFQGLCPFHSEKTPSFTVNDHKGFYYCFGCGASGDGVRFLMDHLKIPFLEAVSQLAGMAGMTMPELQKKSDVFLKREETLYALLEEATQFFEKTLEEVAFAKEYLEGRHLSLKERKDYRLGFATNRVIDHLLKKGFLLSDMTQGGIIQNQGSRTLRFRDRLIFPIFDTKKRVISFGGRAMLKDQEPKYLNGPETLLFHKSVHLYGHSHLHSIRPENPLIVVEGYIDVIRAQSYGFNAVAPLGTALTTDHIQRLWRMSQDPVLCFDGDAAGQKALLRAAFKCLPILKPGFSLNFCTLPTQHDPDSFLLDQGEGAFQTLIHSAKSLVDILLEDYKARLYTTSKPEEKAAIKESFLKDIESIEDKNIRSFYKEAFYTSQAQHSFSPKHKIVSHSLPLRGMTLPPKRDVGEKILLVTLLNHPTLVAMMAELISQIMWTVKGANELVEALLLFGNSGEEKIPNELLQNFSSFIRMLKTEDVQVLAPFSRSEATLAMAEEGFLHIFHKLVTKEQLLTALGEVKGKLQKDFDASTWQLFQKLKTEFQNVHS